MESAVGPEEVGARRARVWAAVAWTVAILVACWMPEGRLPVPEEGPAGWRIPHKDKAIHLGLFAVFGVLWMRAATGPRRAAWIVIGGLVLAVVSELGQGVPAVSRDPDVFDALADAAGLVLGVWAVGRRRARAP